MQQVLFGGKQVRPGKVACIGRNYVEHIEELGNEIPSQMVIFNKPNSAITDTLRYFAPECRYECEICLLIRNDSIAGVGIGLDLTHADIQNRLKEKGLPWERAKAFDGAAVLSEFIPLDGDAVELLHFTLYHNGSLAQEADHSLMIYKPSEMIPEIQSFMSLEDNDIIMTGTPKGVSNYAQGDRLEARLYLEDELLIDIEWIAQ